ncbi:MAG: hypothetical protein KC910_01475 [Candidatus Eremiobacteraeota bacterium]|nr:hypothetical protein [Candidatus Eremiobacteraeota bacterium]
MDKRWQEWWWLVGLWALSRLILSLVGWLSLVYLPNLAPHHHPGPWYEMWSRLDSLHYLRIADQGYLPGLGGTCAWFPGYPLLVRSLSWCLPPTLAGLMISNLALLGSMLVLWELFRERYERAVCRRVVALWLAFPSAFFLSAVYSESTFLLFSAGAFLAARRQKWALAGLLGALAATTRPTGLLLVLALYFEPRQHRTQLLWLGLIPLPVLAFFWHLKQVVHDFFAYVHAQNWLAGLVGGWTNFQLQHLVGVLLALLAAWLVWSAQLERSEKVYAALSILLPLWQLLGASMVRYLVVVFPVFEAAGARLEGRPYLLFAGLLALLQLVMFAFFVASHPAVA